MSRFSDKLKQCLQVTPPTLGFKPVQVTSKPKLVLVAYLNQAEAAGVADAVAGADAAMLNLSKTAAAAKTLKAIAKAVPDIPWGVWLEGDDQSLKQLEAAGVDFVVFAPDKMPLASLDMEKPGKVLAIAPSLDDSLVRSINDLPVEAVLFKLEEAGAPLTWADLMRFRRLSDFLAKPLLVAVSAAISATEVKALWEAGVDGLVVEVTEGQSSLKDMRRMLDGLSLPPKRKWLKIRPLVPVIREEAAPTADEEEEEDEP